MIVPADAAFLRLGHDHVRSATGFRGNPLTDLEPECAADIESMLQDIERGASEQFETEGVDLENISFKRFGKFRYQNQEHTTEVELGESPVTPERVPSITNWFHAAYEREYTYRLDAPVEMVGVHVVATAKIGKMEMTPRAPTGRSSNMARKPARTVDYALEGTHEAAIYDGARLEPGMRLNGPAIIEDAGSTVVMHPGNKAEIDGFGNVVIEI